MPGREGGLGIRLGLSAASGSWGEGLRLWVCGWTEPAPLPGSGGGVGPRGRSVPSQGCSLGTEVVKP